MEDRLKETLSPELYKLIADNPDLFKAVTSAMSKSSNDDIEKSIYQANSGAEATATDNYRVAVQVLDYALKELAYPREIMADIKSGHIYFKAEDGTELGKTKELEERINLLFGDGDGATGNDIKIKVTDIVATTLGTALAELINTINASPTKYNVKCTTVGSVSSLQGLPTIDGYTLKSGDRILVKDQVDKSTNGIYVVDTGTWIKPNEYNSIADVKGGCSVIVENGRTNAMTLWSLLPFNTASPLYEFRRINRILTTKDVASDTSITIDPVAETITLKERHDEDEIFTRVKVTKEGIIKEGFRYEAKKLVALSDINTSSFEREEVLVGKITTANKLNPATHGVTISGDNANTTKGMQLIKLPDGTSVKFLPATSSEVVYLDNNGTPLSDVINNNAVISGTSTDEFIAFNFNTSAVKLHYFRFMAVLNSPNEIYVADFIIKGESGMMDAKLNEFTESSGRPDVKIYNNTVVVDLKNVKSYKLFSSYYGTIYDKYVKGPNNIV
ncbi:MAG: hypothetical protein ACRCX2_28195, partial [Paraclostridium sp.]